MQLLNNEKETLGAWHSDYTGVQISTLAKV